MPRTLPPELTWVVLAGKSLVEVEEAAIRAAFIRHHGNRTKIRAELRIGKMSLLRRLDMMGLRNRPTPRHLTEKAISLAFFRHCRDIMRELKISDSTLMRWINAKAPFTVEEK